MSASSSRPVIARTRVAKRPSAIRPASRSSLASSASRLAVSARVSSIACRTPGLTCCRNTLTSSSAASATIRK